MSGLNNVLDTAKERMGELKVQSKRKVENTEKCMTDKIGDMVKGSNKCVNGVPEGEKRKNGVDKIFKKD